MNIVVLDGYTTNPGDLSWKNLESLGTCTIYERTAHDEILQRAKDAEIVIINKIHFTKEIIAQLPKVKYIGLLSTGVNVVDVTAAKERGIVVTNVPAYSTQSVAQLVFALIFELTHHVGHHAHAVQNGQWMASKDFAFWNFPLVELAGKTMGIVGFGSIGQSVAKIASALEMDVVVSTRSKKSVDGHIKFVDIDTLFKTSDVISLHCPLTEETKHLVNAEKLSMMKPSAFLINTSRGGVIDEQALANALNTNRLAGAGLDVLSKEPPTNANPLLTAKNCLITPHIAWATKAARERLMKTVVENVKAFLDGRPMNVVE
ncbi:MAG: D-2-hydroxyacid dehydrogenase [Bacteroidota bacterium]|nr:D-2-hydroxyacid dehydrogenase [Bacteroidota bacterium]